MSSSTEDRIAVARIGRPHGIRGAVTAVSLSDDSGRFRPGARFQTDEREPRELTLVEAGSRQPGGLLLRFAEISNRSDAEHLRGHALTIGATERRELTEGEYWPEQLVGLEVRSPDGRKLGRIQSVVSGPAQDRLVVELAGGGVIEVPFVDDLVPEVSLGEGTATIVPIEGLLS